VQLMEELKTGGVNLVSKTPFTQSKQSVTQHNERTIILIHCISNKTQRYPVYFIWWYHPKYVEQFTDKINCVTLRLVGYILEYCYDARTDP